MTTTDRLKPTRTTNSASATPAASDTPECDESESKNKRATHNADGFARYREEKAWFKARKLERERDAEMAWHRRFKDQNEDLSAQLQESRKQVEQEKTVSDDLAKDLDYARKERNTARADLRTVTGELASARAELNQVRKERDQARQGWEDADKAVDAFSLKLATTQAAKAEAELDRDRARTMGGALYNAILTKIESFYEKGSRALEWDVLPSEIERIYKALSTERQQRERAEKERNEARTRVEQCNTTYDQMVSELATLRAALVEAQASYAEMRDSLDAEFRSGDALAHQQIATERLSGNIVKEEFWKGEESAWRQIRAVLSARAATKEAK